MSPARRSVLPLLAALACAPRESAPTVTPTPTPAPASAAASAEEAPAAPVDALAAFIAATYDKREVAIPMRDGVKLHTAIYTPKDAGPDKTYPILMIRTPYSVAPYGDELPKKLGPSEALARDGYIFVYQDVRGRFMSEGTFENVRPHRPDKAAEGAIDESSDTYDTITWLLAELAQASGRVGQWGISYPGFYAAAGMIDHHPALVAVSPQAPIADWYFDDFYHHGAFFLPHFFNFFVTFGRPQERPTTTWGERFEHGTADGYAFFHALGSLANVDARYFKGGVAFWREVVEHPTYDEFWRARNLLPHLKGVAPAVMVVGGWFDAEDLYGPLNIYRAIERQNPGVQNHLVMGPWQHGGWARTAGDHLGNVAFGAATSAHYQEAIERAFFTHHLKGAGVDGGPPPIAEATVFATGADAWRSFDAWPPPGLERRALYPAAAGGLTIDAAPGERAGADRFVSDPARPVPFTEDVHVGMTREYMTDDQRFAARRPDVLVYQTAPLSADLTLAGPIDARLWVSTSQRDADWVVKVIDVFPDDAPDHEHLRPGKHMAGYQMMVRSEVLRGRYRGGYERALPFTPGAPTEVTVPLQDVLHTFKAGHRIMIQIQSTWFPLVDRNPQRWVPNIFKARDQDFTAATHTLYRSAKHPSRIEVGVLPGG